MDFQRDGKDPLFREVLKTYIIEGEGMNLLYKI